MSAVTGIEWTDRTWNPVTGCTKVSPGCAHCYAEGVADRFWATQYLKVTPSGAHSNAIPASVLEDYERDGLMRPRRFTDLWTHDDRLGEPQRWKKPQRIFVNSMSDLFHEDVPEQFIAEVWKTMKTISRHTYQILTKRPARMLEVIPRLVATFGVLPNVWLGVSVENQHFADERIPLLLQTPAAVRFISAEPLLGPVDLNALFAAHFEDSADDSTLDWVIVGGESGPGARPCDLEWVRSIIEQCHAAGMPVFVKQLGARPSGAFYDVADGEATLHNRLSVLGFHDRKGGDPGEWPPGLNVREFPEC